MVLPDLFPHSQCIQEHNVLVTTQKQQQQQQNVTDVSLSRYSKVRVEDSH